MSGEVGERGEVGESGMVGERPAGESGLLGESVGEKLGGRSRSREETVCRGGGAVANGLPLAELSGMAVSLAVRGQMEGRRERGVNEKRLTVMHARTHTSRCMHHWTGSERLGAPSRVTVLSKRQPVTRTSDNSACSASDALWHDGSAGATRGHCDD